MGELLVRRMTAEDVPAVHRIETAAFACPWSAAAFASELRDNRVARYFVAADAGEVVAYGGMHVILDEAHVTNVAVRADRRGRGVGRLLMQALMRCASSLGAGYLTLEVRRSNAAAISLYRSLGFFQVSVRKKYYEDNGEDALLMVCDRLPPADPDYTEPETTRESG